MLTDKLEEKFAQLEKEKQAKAEKIKELSKVAKRLLSSDDGKYFVKELRKYCNIDDVAFNLNPQILAYQQGQRNVFITFFDILLRNENDNER